MNTKYAGLIDVSNPNPGAIDIRDIAHSLSQQNRYNGYTQWPYSVAQHCVVVAEVLEPLGPEMQFRGLMHDATEAYVSDLPYPIKQALRRMGGTHFDYLELLWRKVIAVKFDLPRDVCGEVAEVDKNITGDEMFTLLGKGEPSYGIKIAELAPRVAEAQFLHKYYELCYKTQRESTGRVSTARSLPATDLQYSRA